MIKETRKATKTIRRFIYSIFSIKSKYLFQIYSFILGKFKIGITN